MGQRWKYFDYTLRSIQEIEIMTEKALNGISGYVPFSAGDDKVSAELRKVSELPLLADIHGITLTSVTVDGVLTKKTDAYPVFTNILNKGAYTYGLWGNINLIVNYEEKCSQQTAIRQSVQSTGFQNGRCQYSIYECQSMVGKDKQYAGIYWTRLLNATSLPLEMIKDEDGYRFIHIDGGYNTGTSPHFSAFTCELSIVSVEEQIKMLQNGVNVSANRRFSYEWHIASTGKTKPEEVALMYNQLLTDAFPAEYYNIRFYLKLETLQAIDALRLLCKGKGKYSTEIGSFTMKDGNSAWINLITTTQGHYVELETYQSLDSPDEINNLLGLELKEASR